MTSCAVNKKALARLVHDSRTRKVLQAAHVEAKIMATPATVCSGAGRLAANETTKSTRMSSSKPSECERGSAIITSFGLNSSERSEEHTSELQSLMRKSYAVFCLKKNTKKTQSQIQYYQNIKS